MSGVDLGEQECKKWYIKLFRQVLNIPHCMCSMQFTD